MSEYPIIAFMALLMLAYGSISKRADASIITAPMVFTLVGILVSLVPNELLREGPKAPYVKVLSRVILIACRHGVCQKQKRSDIGPGLDTHS